MYIGFYTHQEIIAVGKDDKHLFDEHEFGFESYRIRDFRKFIFEYESNNFSVKINRRGLIGIRIHSIESELPLHQGNASSISENSLKKWALYVEHVNAFQIALMTASLSCGNKFDICSVDDLEREDIVILNPDFQSIAGMVDPNNSTYIRMRKSIGHSFISSTHCLFEEHFNYAVQVFEQLISSSSTSHAATLARARAYYGKGNNNLALVVSWFDIEVLLKKKLKTYLIDPVNNTIVNDKTNARRFNKDRVKKLVDEMEVSQVIEMLELLNIISFDMYESITQCRKERNKLVHRYNHNVKSTIAATCADELLRLINSTFGIELKVSFSSSYSNIG